ncbi:MAG: MobA/MobL family protein, partial [Pseudomonadota bacterium]|nr:MobA/MobL family protein [Pseudomonadota bacterium]
MASYHLSVKTVSRSTGRSGPGAAAYRTASLIECERDGTVHDYRGRRGVETAFVVVPEGAEWALDRAVLWNAAEAAEKRKDAKVAREYELALPCELDAHGRAGLALEFATAVVGRFGVAADVAIHAPGREGDHRNWHAHVLTTTRVVDAEGLGAKTRELDVAQTAGPAVEALRELWAIQVNHALERIQAAARVDHRSFARQGQDREAEQHMGVAASGMERKAARQEREQAQARERVASAPVPAAPEGGGKPVGRPGEATEAVAGVKEQSVATTAPAAVPEPGQDRLQEIARAAPALVEAPEPVQERQTPRAAQEGLERPRTAQERGEAVWPVAITGPELDPTVRPSAGVFGAGTAPVTRIGQRNAEIQERNRVLEAAQRALEAAQRVLEGLERAARRVLDLARGLGTQAAAEREARVQEAKRQRQERERAAAERRAELERQERARV